MSLHFPIETALNNQKSKILKYVNFLKVDLGKYPRVIRFGKKNQHPDDDDGVITTPNQIFTRYLELGDRFHAENIYNKKSDFININLFRELTTLDTRPIQFPLNREPAYLRIKSVKEREYITNECAKYLCNKSHTGSKNLQKTAKDPDCDCYWCLLIPPIVPL